MEQLTIVGVTTALTELAKRIGIPEKYRRFTPLLAIAIGIVVAFMILDAPIKVQILQGLLSGLTATGIYSAGKNVKQGTKK